MSLSEKLRKIEEEEKALKQKKRELLKKHQEEVEKENCKKVNISLLQSFIGKDVRLTNNGQAYNFNIKKIDIKNIELDFGDFSYSAKDVKEFKRLLNSWVKDFAKSEASQEQQTDEPLIPTTPNIAGTSDSIL